MGKAPAQYGTMEESVYLHTILLAWTTVRCSFHPNVHLIRDIVFYLWSSSSGNLHSDLLQMLRTLQVVPSCEEKPHWNDD